MEEDLSKIALNYDDFINIFSNDFPDPNTTKMKIELQKRIDQTLRFTNVPANSLNNEETNITGELYKKLIIEDEEEISEKEDYIKTMRETIIMLSNIIDDESKDEEEKLKLQNKRIKNMENDIVTHNTFLEEIISNLFKDNAQMILILNELFNLHFEDNTKYIDLKDNEHSIEIINTLCLTGLIELNPDDKQQIKIKNLIE